MTVSFFVLAGYFVPGAVLMATLIPALTVGMPGSCPNCVVLWLGSLNTTAALALAVPVLSVTLAVGAILSDAFTSLGWLLYGADRTRSFKDGDPVDKILTDPLAREGYVFQNAQEKDFHGWVGRIRIIGGSGLAFFFGGLTLIATTEPKVGAACVLFGVCGLVVGCIRNRGYHRNLDVEAALLRALEREKAEAERQRSERLAASSPVPSFVTAPPSVKGTQAEHAAARTAAPAIDSHVPLAVAAD